MSDQDEVVAFLSRADTHAGAETVDVVQTHGAFIFLAGAKAYKIKRAVRYDYLDFSTLDLRAQMLRRELELNRRAAPSLYRDVVPVTRAPDGRLALGGEGEPVEWVLRMQRFSQDDVLDRVAERGALDLPLAEALGASVARYHETAPRRTDLGGAVLISDILAELRREFATMEEALGASDIATVLERAEAALSRVGALLDDRAAGGFVRRCHGDLHLRNIVLLDGAPVPFDALEFDETLGTCDVLYDLAFLLMDLAHRGLVPAANRVLNRYLHSDGRDENITGLAALPLFLGVRAAISAMVAVQTARARGDAAGPVPQAQGYLAHARQYLDPPPPRLIAVGGLSGTGKTTAAAGLAPAIGAVPGAVHLRTDLIRKAMAGVAPTERLPAEAYTPGKSAEIYARLQTLAGRALSAGHSVIVDAVFLEPARREAVERLAAAHACAFKGLWLEADAADMEARVTSRTGDASDADASVVRQQVTRDPGPISWIRIDAGGAPEQTLERCRAALARTAPGPAS